MGIQHPQFSISHLDLIRSSSLSLRFHSFFASSFIQTPRSASIYNTRASLTFAIVYPLTNTFRPHNPKSANMVSKTLLITLMIAYVEARFGQEQVPIAAISSVQGGNAGAAATIAGATISDLLGAANACAKLSRADDIVAQLGGGADAIAAAIGLVAAEKNTNPFANGNAQNVCGDPALPATAELRGITPLIDPAVDVDGAVAALSKQSQGTPLTADGMSVFDLMSAAGFGDLVVSQTAAGGAAAGGNANAGNANQNAGNANQNAGNANQNAGNANQNAGNANQGAGAGNAAKGKGNANQGAGACNAVLDGAAAGNATQNAGNAANTGNAAKGKGNANQGAGAGNAANGKGNANQNAGNANQNAGNANQNAGNANQNAGNANQNAGNANQNAGNANQNAGNANQGAAAGGAAAGGAAAGGAADFGTCTPTITFQGGEGNRAATEFTFQIADPVARGGQGEALNPNIITNALCNQLTNVCGANAAAKTLCEDGKAQVAAAGTRNKSTADLFNTALGFAGAVTNPAGGPADVAPKKMARGMRRGLRA
jgi:hypothetical protein